MARTKWTFDSIPDLSGKTIIVTGGNNGIGYESGKAFALNGARVILACRSMEKGEKAKAEILKLNPRGSIEVMKIDLMDLSSIRSFAETFTQKNSGLDVLMNSAGILATTTRKTKDGFDAIFGTNYLGHFALTGHLIDHLKSSPNSRVVNVTSLAHRGGKLDFDDLMFETYRKYKPFRSYSQSKLANLLFTYELQRYFENNQAQCIAVAAHPGVTNTNLINRIINKWHMNFLAPVAKAILPTAAKGALSQIRAAVDPEVKGAQFYGPNGLNEAFGYPVLVKSTPASHNLDDAKKLWEVSEKLTGVQY